MSNFSFCHTVLHSRLLTAEALEMVSMWERVKTCYIQWTRNNSKVERDQQMHSSFRRFQMNSRFILNSFMYFRTSLTLQTFHMKCKPVITVPMSEYSELMLLGFQNPDLFQKSGSSSSLVRVNRMFELITYSS